ncbi:hypothetical protein KL86CLO1_11614 [uncultured Eubacteriales bacterium]|uniref:Uncharacterized protein n=1 Tax=uncultured Eubacteriales bacterium TaxID=172733 RepID=A0A212JS35_9FIRM|nr:hypothetical protein KL86CLO1_11614 [uncultured Eubacteriales bacterium]
MSPKNGDRSFLLLVDVRTGMVYCIE